MTIETRAYETDLEVRTAGDGRTVCGICVPYNQVQRINATLSEVFIRGAFANVVRASHRVKFLVGHDANALPIGRATLLREDETGLYGEFRISDTERGSEVLTLIRDGALSELSIGFSPLKDKRRQDGVVERQLAHLAEVSAVTFGAYGAAASVVGVSDQSSTPNLDALEEILRGVRRA
jgi:HK97 family phage prohead protease